jgi:hypothetical protein
LVDQNLSCRKAFKATFLQLSVAVNQNPQPTKSKVSLIKTGYPILFAATKASSTVVALWESAPHHFLQPWLKVCDLPSPQ